MFARQITALTLGAAVLGLAGGAATAGTGKMDKAAVLSTYADIAQAGYEDSLTTAQTLDRAIDALLAAPSPTTLAAARAAWLAARVPYQQTEVYRFGNAIVDDWEGKVNAWPLDEGLIDYVDASYGQDSDENMFYAANVIRNPKLLIGGKTLDATVIDKNLIRSLHEIDEVEANVSTGYHAIEFLLWGQDLNGTGPGAGTRPATDFATGSDCTGGSCERRRAYLKAASTLLIDDLMEMVANWSAGGAARTAVAEGGPEKGLAVILTGMGSLSYGELAGERMKLGLLLNDPEEEHDCFSDNTHNSHYYDALGIRNVYLGSYRRIDGRVVQGPGLSAIVKAKAADVDAELRGKLNATVGAMTAIRTSAESGRMSYDQMLGEGNAKGNAMVQAAVDALLDQTKSIEKAVAALGLGALEFEGSDSLDNPTAVFQ